MSIIYLIRLKTGEFAGPFGIKCHDINKGVEIFWNKEDAVDWLKFHDAYALPGEWKSSDADIVKATIELVPTEELS